MALNAANTSLVPVFKRYNQDALMCWKMPGGQLVWFNAAVYPSMRQANPEVPGIVDLTDLVDDSSGVARIVLDAVQDMLLRVALQTARDDYETRRKQQREGTEVAKRAGRYTGRKSDLAHHRRIIGLRDAGLSIARTVELASCSIAQVKRVTALHRAKATPVDMVHKIQP